MAEYIERDNVIDEIDRWLDSVGTVLIGKGLSYYGELIGCVEDAPAADVAPVRHGWWMDGKCTACGWEEPDTVGYDGYELEAWHHTRYCPNCGAKMGW